MRKLFLLVSILLISGGYLLAQTVDVTFKVDMSIRIATGKFVPTNDTVFVRGSFNGWGKTAMVDDGDSVYSVTVTGQPQNTDLSYKFYYNAGSSWESDPNRSINTGTGATLVLDPYFFNDRTPNTGAASSVTFSVDMHLPAQGEFDPAVDHVFIAGNFTNWQNAALEMTDPEGDTTFTLTVNDFHGGDLAIYKFVWSHTTAASGNWESPTGEDVMTNGNRIYGIHDGDNTVDRWWNNQNPNVTLANGNIFFEVDMSVLTELGVFDPNTDSVQIRGAFNGWNANDPTKSLMSQNAANENDWYIEIPFVQEILNSTQMYKFFIKNAPSSPPYANTGWEVPIRNTNGSDRNRGLTFLGSPTQVAPYSWFENINPDWVIPTGTTVECTFRVDMTNATLADSQFTDPLFNPATDTVYWIPRQPLYYALNGLTWPGAYPKILRLTDQGNNIYAGTLTLTGPSYNGWLYNYAFTHNGSLEHEGKGSVISQGDCRVRFVGQSGGARTFDTPWTMPLDNWGNGPFSEEDHPLGWIDNVKEIPGNPETYSLEQNYPNPFNPSTTIRFSVPEAGLVTLKVFNLLGEQVATLVNSDLAKGRYEINFKGNDISSGIYFYTLKAGNYVSTKKMILLK
jgi:hypothetical protein